MPATEFTLEVGEDLREVMDAHREIDWAKVLRRTVREHAAALKEGRESPNSDEDARARALVEHLERRV